MGTRSEGDAGNWSQDGGLPGLPPEWGPITIPDDPSELAREAAQVRRELRREARRRSRSGGYRLLGDDPSARIAGVVVLVAVVAMLAGLFTLGYSGERHALAPTSTAANAPVPPPSELPALDLLDDAGRAVSLRSLLPAVVLLTEGCECGDLVSASMAAAPPGVSVVVVTHAVPALPAARDTGAARALADPADDLSDLLGAGRTDGRAGVLLIAANAEIIRTLPAATSVEEFRTDLGRLAARPAQAPPG